MNILNSERRVSSDELRSESMHRWLRTCTNPKSQIPNPKSSRRGILLLVVLSMLTLFLMIGMAYLVSANHYRKTNKTMAQASITSYLDIDRGALLEQALLQLVRDTGNQFSSIRFHSLLRDMYGNDGFTATTETVNWAGAANVTNGQMITLKIQNLYQDLSGIEYELVNSDGAITDKPLSVIDNAYNGLTLTFLEGPSEGLTTRIVGYRDPDLFTVLTVPLTDGTTLANPVDLANYRILVNGRPFNGTGVGLDRFATTGARAIANELVNGTNRRVALMPNASFLDVLQVTLPSSTTGLTFEEYFLTDQEIENLSAAEQETLVKQRGLVGLGGSDESYDAPDFQNMALAMIPVGPGESAIPSDKVLVDRGPDGILGTADDKPLVLPSFHRPALINYWQNNTTNPVDFTIADNASLLRKVLFRPNWFDHPIFTGSNPEYAAAADPTEKINRMIYGPWDVDNDNDGVRDGIWTDIGSPVMAGPDGRLVKPLVSFLVLDLDGRVNVNMHGTIEHIRNVGHPAAKSVAGGIMSSGLPRGQGYGPADISLAPVLEDRYDEILQGTIDVAGRYGDSLQIEPNGDTNRTDPSERYPGERAIYDLVAQLKQQGLPTHTSELSNYVSPPDFHGRYRFGINDIGQPVYEAIDDSFAFDTDTPYETNNSLGTSRGESASAADALYSLAELERLLRAYDVDAVTLPSRLWDLGNIISQPTKRNQITTDSVDLPVPNVVVPEWMLAAPGAAYASVMGKPAVNASFADLLEYRIRAENPAISEVNLRQLMALLLPQDLADGLRMDINRPFGNGRDDDDDGVVDEPGEPEGSYWQMTNITRLANGNLDSTDPRAAFTGDDERQYSHIHDSVDRNGDGIIELWERGDKDGDETLDDSELASLHVLRRQHMARDMYVLAMTLVDPFDPSSTVARRLAQWAVNIVDFRDPDAIMTPFEFDTNPFDGWGNIDLIDGIPNGSYTATSQTQLVWGSEQPELVLTETMNWHDRRTIDTGREGEPSLEEDDSHEKGDVNSTKDLSQDQEQRPQGASFVEIYNPSPDNPSVSSNLGVDLAALDQLSDASPVWRLMVYKDGGPHKDPDSSDPLHRPDNDLQRNSATPVADRSVYFGGFDPNYDDDGVAFFNSTTNLVPSVRPGRYMVVGAGEQVEEGEYLAKFGENTSQSSPRGIRLRTAGADNAVHAVSLLGKSGDPVMDENSIRVDAPADDGTAIPRLQGDSHQCISSVAIIDQTASGPRRFTISEPATGYPNSVSVKSDKGFSNSAWDGSKYVPILDMPLDDQRAKAAAGGGVGGGGRALNSGLRDGETRLALPLVNKGDRTIPAFSWIYLQRLANPQIPWNPPAGKTGHDPTLAINPYLTVDSMGANLTVFNGLSSGEKRLIDGQPQTFSNNNCMQSFCSLQRGRANDATEPYRDFAAVQTHIQLGKRRIPLKEPSTAPPFVANLWATERIDASTYWRNRGGPTGLGNEGVTDHYFEAIPDCTLGFLNEPFRGNTTSPAPADLRDRILPQQPFPWINWNNRPYISANELMQVPAYCSSQLLHAFSYSAASGANRQDEKYGQNGGGGGSDDSIDLLEDLPIAGASEQPKLDVDGRHGHLLNFFRTEGTTDDIVGLHRVLEYVHVPSRFVGTEMWLNPVSFGDPAPLTSTDDPRHGRQPPFNRISSYRDPGQMNLNTISDKGLDALFHRNSDSLNIHPGPDWVPFRDSRRGYGGSSTLDLENTVTLDLENTVPTFFENPFRSSEAGTLVPLLNMIRKSVECTVLRSDNVEGVTAGTDAPLFVSTSTAPHSNADRNSYFRYQPLTRLDNLTTTRSNVYAVWVTVGFFEVEAAPGYDQEDLRWGGDRDLYNRVYPEGYQLGKEAGIDTGDVVRVREFAVIDRSIPVAFEPGADHNVEQVIRLRRRIE